MSAAPVTGSRVLAPRGRRRWLRVVAFGAVGLPFGSRATPAGPPVVPAWTGRSWPVAPGQDLAQAIERAADGDTVELAPGVYRGQAATVRQRRLRLRCRDGLAVLQADGAHAEGKALIVVRQGDVEIEGLEFRGARVADANGAGIRFERGRLQLRRCGFFDNQMGLLTANFDDAELALEDCRFGQAPPNPAALAHLLYVGRIARLAVQGCHFSGGRRGHLLKSRARVNELFYNQLDDGPDGQASYELEFPHGGVAWLVGNRLVQSPASGNRTLLSFGAEGHDGRPQQLVLSHNTFVNLGPGPARFVEIHRFKLLSSVQPVMRNNLFIGRGSSDGPWQDAALGNHALALASSGDAAAGPGPADCHWSAAAGRAWPAMAAGEVQGRSLRPQAQFQAPAGVRALPPGQPLQAGACQER